MSNLQQFQVSSFSRRDFHRGFTASRLKLGLAEEVWAQVEARKRMFTVSWKKHYKRVFWNRAGDGGPGQMEAPSPAHARLSHRAPKPKAEHRISRNRLFCVQPEGLPETDVEEKLRWRTPGPSGRGMGNHLNVICDSYPDAKRRP